MQVLLTNETPMPFPSNVYDVVVCYCAMVPAHIHPECLPVSRDTMMRCNIV